LSDDVTPDRVNSRNRNWPKFFRNKSEQFEGRFSLIKVDGDSSVFFNGMKGSQFPIAVAHGEGKAVFDSEETASALKQSGNITLRYIDNYGEIAEQYPANPNGSIDGIAGFVTTMVESLL
jgi:phosphoribosylformylglycinamidine synthase